MRKWILITSIALTMLGLQACAPKSQDDCGFVQNVYGERISWKDQLPVVMKVHSSVPNEYLGAIQAAAQTWNNAAGKTLIVIENGKVSGDPGGRDRQNVISFSTTWEQDKLSEQAKTSVHWIGDQIQESDIKVNASKKGGNSVFSFYWEGGGTGSVNIEALVLHEMGHVLGLKHKDGAGSVMATYLANNSDRVELQETDQDALNCEY